MLYWRAALIYARTMVCLCLRERGAAAGACHSAALFPWKKLKAREINAPGNARVRRDNLFIGRLLVLTIGDRRRFASTYYKRALRIFGEQHAK